MKKITAYFVRHGQTYFNLMRKMQGWSDAPLTDKGIADLEKTAQGLANIKFDAFYSSDLKRAMDTAQMIMERNLVRDSSLNLKLDQNFREVGFGIFEGLDDTAVAQIIGTPYGLSTFDEIEEKFGIDGIRDFTKQADTSGFAEDAAAVYHRMDLGMQDLLEQNDDGSTILVVSHGGFIRMLAEKYQKSNDQKSVIHFPKNGSVTKVELTDESIIITDFARPNDQL